MVEQLLLVGIPISYAVLYYIIKHAVTAGILDADRKKELAKAERKRVMASKK